jgi:hypothetical protein
MFRNGTIHSFIYRKKSAGFFLISGKFRLSIIVLSEIIKLLTIRNLLRFSAVINGQQNIWNSNINLTLINLEIFCLIADKKLGAVNHFKKWGVTEKPYE